MAKTIPSADLNDFMLVDRLIVGCRRTGSWTEAAVWLAGTLNAIDGCATSYVAQELPQRTQRDELISRHVSAVEGDQRDPDLIRLPDGTKVCWHLGSSRRVTRWVVEVASEPCSYGRRP